MKQTLCARRHGFSAFELTIVVALLAVFVSLLADRLLEYQERAEYENVRQTVALLQGALQVEAVNRVLRAPDTLAQLQQINPMLLLAVPPNNYIGELDPGRADNAAAGTWYFDQSSHQLVYRPARSRHVVSIHPERRLFYTVSVMRDGVPPRLFAVAFQPAVDNYWY